MGPRGRPNASPPLGVEPPMAHTRLSWDWKQRPSVADLTNALAPFGVKVYADPSCENSDAFGFVFSSEELGSEDLEAIADEDG